MVLVLLEHDDYDGYCCKENNDDVIIEVIE